MYTNSMLPKYPKLSLFLITILALFLAADIWSKVFFLHLPYRILWYSTIGLALTIIALITENKFLVTMAFCALFVIEGI